MKFRTTLLLCGAALLVSAPAWADGISPASTREFERNRLSAAATVDFGLKLNSPYNKGIGAEFTPPGVAIHQLELNESLDISDSSHSKALGALFFAREKKGIDPVDFIPLDSHRGGTSTSRGEEDGESNNEGESDARKGKVRISGNLAVVPEPESLSLLLLGLAAVGSLARRRGQSPMMK